jgi:hypothetical protein
MEGKKYFLYNARGLILRKDETAQGKRGKKREMGKVVVEVVEGCALHWGTLLVCTFATLRTLAAVMPTRCCLLALVRP